MAHALMSRGTLIVDEVLQSSAVEAVEAVGDRRPRGTVLQLKSGDDLELGEELSRFILDVVARVAQGGSVAIQTVPEVLTTSTAARMLGVSRPTLMKLIKKGDLPATMVGTHHRVLHTDLVKLREVREAERHAAIESLLELEG
ncbi:DNA binding domain-containing protein, excisionase family [Ruaniaceae bacterium KH17]|nr:DNA binding domain-containing protein, excisionase family [Ruaniaceae bacterium KH17]